METQKGLNTRQLLLEATMDELARRGSDEIEIGLICRSLNVSPGLVNHYFGDRSGLLLDAAMTSYEQYVEGQVKAVQLAGDDPELQLKAWISSQVEWTIAHPGIASVMNFPQLHLPEGKTLSVDDRLRLESAAARNLITLASVLDRIQRGTIGREVLAREAITSNFPLASATAYVGWLVYGHALWRAGQHAPTADIPEVRDFEAAVFSAFPRVAINIVKGLAQEGAARPRMKG